MFVRSELKMQAKSIIKRKYFVMVLVSLIGAFACSSLFELQFELETESAVLYLFNWMPMEVNYQKALMMALPLVIVGVLWMVFVSFPAQAGIADFFKKASLDKEKIEDIWGVFKNNYGHNVKVMFLTELRIALWALLLIIPGIMKMYSYYFVKFLVTDYPELEADEIMEMSEKMSEGIRFELFVFDLSFILWSFLAAFISLYTFGLGGVLVQPYVSQSGAQLYHWVKENRLLVEVNIEEVTDDESNCI